MAGVGQKVGIGKSGGGEGGEGRNWRELRVLEPPRLENPKKTLELQLLEKT